MAGGKLRKNQRGYVPGVDTLGRGTWNVDLTDPDRVAKSAGVADALQAMTTGSFDRSRLSAAAADVVAAVGPMEAARAASAQLDDLPVDPVEARRVAYTAGATCAHAATAFQNNRGDFPDYADSAPLRELSGRELTDPVADAAFLRGMIDANPQVPRLLNHHPGTRLRFVRCVQNDPELAKAANDVCDSMWKVNLSDDHRFYGVDKFSDLTPQKQEDARLMHQVLAADSIARGKLDEFLSVADPSFRQRRRIARLRRLQDEARELRRPSYEELDLRDLRDEASGVSRRAARWAGEADSSELHNLARGYRNLSRDAVGYGETAKEKMEGIRERRRGKLDAVTGKIDELDVPWWLKEGRPSG